MWKRVGLFLAVACVGLEAERAEARFGKGGSSSSGHSAPSGHSASPVGSGHSSPGSGWSGGRGPSRGVPYYGYGRGYGDPLGYGYYPGYPYGYYAYGSFYNPAWAWPYVAADPYAVRYYDLSWRHRQRAYVEGEREQKPVQLDLSVDGGVVAQGFAVGLGMRLDGERFGFEGKLNMYNLATDDGSLGRDHLSLLSLHPSVSVVNNRVVRWRLSAGMDVAFAPSAIMVGPGVGTSAALRLVGPLKLEASANYTPLPFTQLSGDAGLAVELGVLRLRGGYRTTYLNDQGRVDGVVHTDLLAGPFAGLSLVL